MTVYEIAYIWGLRAKLGPEVNANLCQCSSCQLCKQVSDELVTLATELRFIGPNALPEGT